MTLKCDSLTLSDLMCIFIPLKASWGGRAEAPRGALAPYQVPGGLLGAPAPYPGMLRCNVPGSRSLG